MDTNKKNRIGILCPLSALPNAYGIGDFGYETEKFLKILKDQHIHTWQILPWHPSLQANSPYRAISCYAGDEVYISLEKLIPMGLLTDIEETIEIDEQRVQYDSIRAWKHHYFQIAFSNFVPDEEYQTFISKQEWVTWYAIYQVFSEVWQSPSWNTWPTDYKEYPKYKKVDISIYQQEIDYHLFLQYIFFKQWFTIKALANQMEIAVFGDLPFYVDIDSVEVWRNPEAFLLDAQGNPTMVAGVPPDYFSETGQMWGNPIYDWEYLKHHSFSFWVERLQWANIVFDEIRIDHFRAFDTYWNIPAQEENAIHGHWLEAPGYAVLDTIYQSIDDITLIAEDLGHIRPEVTQLKDQYHILGMKVFQFHIYDSFEHLETYILYTGTHDNETVIGWYNNLPLDVKQTVLSILNCDNEENLHLKIIHFCSKKAKYVITPIWDVMGLDNHARFNVPGTISENNWTFRMTDMDTIEDSIKKMNDFIK